MYNNFGKLGFSKVDFASDETPPQNSYLLLFVVISQVIPQFMVLHDFPIKVKEITVNNNLDIYSKTIYLETSIQVIQKSFSKSIIKT